MGSVKDLTVLKEPKQNNPSACGQELGLGIFTFSDRYSVFDWGEMPDHIPGKGQALAMMAADNFEILRKKGVMTHYVGLMDDNGRIGSIDELATPSNKMVVYLSHVIRPRPIMDGDIIKSYNYEEFDQNRGELSNFLVPLEIVYRNGAPEGSSLFGKIKKATEKGDTNYIDGLLNKTGLKCIEELIPGIIFPKPIYDFSTKLEETGDRTLSDDEAYKISGLNENQFQKMLKTRDIARETIGAICSYAGFVDYDGKVEFTFYNKFGPILCDVLGTFDENRFMFKGEQISKEFLRQWYKKNQPEWYEAIQEAKISGRKDWQNICKIKPRNLPHELLGLLERMYTIGAQRYIQRKICEDDDLEKVMEQLRPYRE